MKRKFYWRKLDDQAKLFALAASNRYNSIFRLSVMLYEEIDPDILQQALDSALKVYPVFKVKMSTGLFWYYFENNRNKALVSQECSYPFAEIKEDKNDEYLFKVTYFNKKINIDFEHSLTDGNGGKLFFEEIIYRYLSLKYPNELNAIKINEESIVIESENAYKKSYKKHVRKSDSSKKAYILHGEQLTKGMVSINHFNIDLEEIKSLSKHRKSTLSIYLLAMYIYSIYEENYRIYKGKKPINVSVPVNLSKYVKVQTVSNFFSYIIVTLNFKKNMVYSFNKVLDMVKKEFDKKLKLDKILGSIYSDAGSMNNIFIRIIPLFLKKLAVYLGSTQVKRHFTTTFSNIGQIEVESKYKKYIDNFFVILSPDWAEKIKCGVCSYKNNLVVTISTNLNDNSISDKFETLLKENNISYTIERNGIDVSS